MSTTNPEADDEAKAIAFIRKVAAAATGAQLTDEQARELFQKAKERLVDALAQTQSEM